MVQMIVLPELDVEIRTCPKVLSTSLKSLAFRLENGFDFTPFIAKGKPWTVHKAYQTRPFSQQKPSGATIRICFVRDPVERLLSAYSNRVLRRHETEDVEFQALKAHGLYDETSLEIFLAHLKTYRDRVPTIKHHTDPQVTYLGRDSAYYTHVFNIGEVRVFEELMADLAGSDIRLPHQQRSSRRSIKTTWFQRRAIKRFYKMDYQVFGRYF